MVGNCLYTTASAEKAPLFWQAFEVLLMPAPKYPKKAGPNTGTDNRWPAQLITLQGYQGAIQQRPTPVLQSIQTLSVDHLNTFGLEQGNGLLILFDAKDHHGIVAGGAYEGIHVFYIDLGLVKHHQNFV